jgi:hypothetical protein
VRFGADRLTSGQPAFPGVRPISLPSRHDVQQNGTPTRGPARRPHIRVHRHGAFTQLCHLTAGTQRSVSSAPSLQLSHSPTRGAARQSCCARLSFTQAIDMWDPHVRSTPNNLPAPAGTSCSWARQPRQRPHPGSVALTGV